MVRLALVWYAHAESKVKMGGREMETAEESKFM